MAAAVSFPAPCVTAEISTVDPSWGLLTPQALSGCPEAEGLAWLRWEGFAWRVVAETPADKAPCSGGTWLSDRSIPSPIAKEFGYCRAPRTYIMCQPRHPRSDLSRVLKVRPRRCDTLGPRDSNAEGANLARLRWRSWGRRTARGRGIELGYHLPFAHIRVRVRAYRRRRCPSGDYLYTRLRVTLPIRHRREEIPAELLRLADAGTGSRSRHLAETPDFIERRRTGGELLRFFREDWPGSRGPLKRSRTIPRPGSNAISGARSRGRVRARSTNGEQRLCPSGLVKTNLGRIRPDWEGDPMTEKDLLSGEGAEGRRVEAASLLV
jgi:hypothetical protein